MMKYITAFNGRTCFSACELGVCEERLKELITNHSFNSKRDPRSLLEQSAICRECAGFNRHPITKRVSDELNTLFCEQVVDYLIVQNMGTDKDILPKMKQNA